MLKQSRDRVANITEDQNQLNLGCSLSLCLGYELCHMLSRGKMAEAVPGLICIHKIRKKRDSLQEQSLKGELIAFPEVLLFPIVPKKSHVISKLITLAMRMPYTLWLANSWTPQPINVKQAHCWSWSWCWSRRWEWHLLTGKARVWRRGLDDDA